jgi:DNA-binding NtrC family response regulator
MTREKWSILVVDDELVMRESLAAWLREDGYAVDTAASGREGLALATKTDYAVTFLDLKMPGMDGIETMQEIRKLRPDAPVIIITAFATVDTAITAMKEGALEYVVKPCNPNEISLLVARVIRLKSLERENRLLREQLSDRRSFRGIISKSPRMAEVFRLVQDVASLRSTVLIQGESGTGKDLIARAIHLSGDRAERPLVAVSCAALAETLLESELFGHEKGAFTGAAERKRGKFELADGGTLFLDEIGDISPKLQVDLLRVLQDRTFFRVGGSEQLSIDVRVIAATNADLQARVRGGSFREDLYYRLNVINVRLPPLRERLEDIPLLAGHFAERVAAELSRDVPGFTDDALARLLGHRWPGNVRELENAVERALVTCRSGMLTAEDFTFLDLDARGPLPGSASLAELEHAAVEATLRRTGGNIKEAAAILGIDRSTLYDKIKKYGIERG